MIEKSIYIVEDEVKLNTLLTSYLTREGYLVKSFLNGTDALNKIKDLPNLWVLDIMLPDTDGFALFNEIKRINQDTPVIFMSARDTDIDRLLGLQLGSEDYLAKPFLPQELVLRCKNVLKRHDLTRLEETLVFDYQDYKINEDKRLVYHGDEEIIVTTKEFDLLVLLKHNIGRSLTRDQVLNKVWGFKQFFKIYLNLPKYVYI